jgi:hypothetical protein
MKRLFLFSLIVAFIIAPTAVYAAEKVPLGIGNLAVKVDYINFTDNLEDDDGLYIGLEGYGKIIPNLYLGAEVGYTNPDFEDTYFVPIELNLKYAVKDTPNFVIDLGAGASYNYAKAESSGGSLSEDDWLFGGQFFIDLNYIVDQFFVGINAKYQLTEELKGFDNFNNWRVGGQIGIMF